MAGRDGMYGERADKGAPADAYFESLDGEIAGIAAEARALVRSACPRAAEVIKWGIPVYELDGERSRVVCAIKAAKAHVNLQFEKGAMLDDPEGMLEGTGKLMRHVKLRPGEKIKKSAIREMLKQAAGLAEGEATG